LKHTICISVDIHACNLQICIHRYIYNYIYIYIYIITRNPCASPSPQTAKCCIFRTVGVRRSPAESRV
jgi:hypothetical protein